jgi:hypothetical protein
MDVRDDKGSVPFQGLIDGGPAPATAYQRLQPEGVVAKNIVLRPFYELDHPGRFTIVAHYSDANPQRPPAPPGTRPAGEATAAPVTITISR